MTTGPSEPSVRRLAGMDVLRGLAIALVMLRHAWPRVFGEAGAVGVAIFFTLSGYLITGVLLRDVEDPPGRLIWRFCRNRALRLLPALLILLLTFGIVEEITNRLADRGMVRSSLILGLTYTSDLPLLHIPISPGISHLWTLAVEEQFYLVWPFVLIGARRRLKTAMAVIAAVAVLLCTVTIVALPHRGEAVYMLPTTWAVTLVIGAAAFVGRNARRGHDRLGGERRWHRGEQRSPELFRFNNFRTARSFPSLIELRALLIATVGILLVLCMLPDAKSHPGWFLVLGPVVSLLTVSLIRVAENMPGPVPASIAPLRYLGIISYGAYLWNLPIVNWLRGPHLANASPWCGAASIPLTIIAAVLSWHLAEKHVARFKRNLDRGRHEPMRMRISPLSRVPAQVITANAA